jgi:UDP-N-acetylglucosamine 4,6-dehydratase/5-epimerase
MINKIEYLITGGTGSLGKVLTKQFLKKDTTKGIRIFSRDELKQWEMRKSLKQEFGNDIPVSFLIGDIRDLPRLTMGAKRVDTIIHTAALKQVPVGENDPLEMVKTNVIGSSNVLEAAIANGVKRVMAISTDKAVMPINLYGATKLCSEKLFLNGNVYSGDEKTRFSVCRYGNVLGSRGSVVPLFKKQFAETGKITVTHEDMTRFWITLDSAVKFILRAIDDMEGNEIFIPMMGSAKITDIAKAIVPKAEIVDIGIRPGEKLHEILIANEESLKAHRDNFGKRFIISNKFVFRDKESFEYTSNGNDLWLSKNDIIKMIG